MEKESEKFRDLVMCQETCRWAGKKESMVE